ncbi:ribonuclease H protein [Pyrus ussuriensis x Pyrus communis]|uniref:Ribonuclease H protein n=1 Tax=Pyrus ussuriensis x Pyrus communis TaxID=2448454 RepID=A0A5N5HBG5_9ROSA|nr:ribonuclease H protein [Pyrus ussuriensis x Pyrus communis]
MSERVVDLIDSSLGQWRNDIMTTCFSSEEARCILSMTLSKFGWRNKLIWHYTKGGVYSVKTGYYIAQDRNRNGELGRKGWGSRVQDKGGARKSRNCLVFEKKNVEPLESIKLIKRQWCQFEELKQEKAPCVDRVQRQAFAQGTDGCGYLPYKFSLMAEADGIRMAVLACIDKDFAVVQVESDSKCLCGYP